MASRFGMRGFALGPLMGGLLLAGVAVLVGLALLASALHDDFKQLANVARLAGVALAALITWVAVAFVLIRRELRSRTALAQQAHDNQAPLLHAERRLRAITDNLPAVIAHFDFL